MRTIRVALVGGGMFGKDVVLRCLADVQRCGIGPYLGTAGLDHRARDLAGVRYQVVAVGTRRAHSGEALASTYRAWVPDADVTAHYGDMPWCSILDERRPEVLFVATPDHLHAAPILAAIERGVHVVAEKPLTLLLKEAMSIAARSKSAGTVVAVDMHKRYDSFLRSAFLDVVPQLGDLLYGRAVLEEPLDVSTKTFKWAASSNPFSYVGVHWTDLFAHYLGVRPVSLHAVGQKRLLARWKDSDHPDGIDTFDAMQVTVQYDSGLGVNYVNAWVNPADFEGVVNQELEIVGTRGRVSVDQQDRGMRSSIEGRGTRTHNPHFQAEIPRVGERTGHACIGYGKDSLIAGLEAASRVVLGLSTRADLAGTYPDAESAMTCVAILEAAATVATANHGYLSRGMGAPVSACFEGDDYRILDPCGL
ncbi:MAG TPA: Gfo/Idh/MocA family oxidoreductase [Phycisphaerae bacterium]|nr:Gfo/Idh/MocA family oxidoreductase [Phycisphaerae bacterium]HRY67413.1 Gfo/Idh/MocA family oxidoreductase [Phycisphaerae bacterium]HSA28996.1 Gfo/Idh/MocA family oxidoreductase [Phycisphaerae bacterium]